MFTPARSIARLAHPLCMLMLGATSVGAASTSATPLGFTDVTLSPEPTGNITNTTLLTSFTTSVGTTSTVASAVSASGSFTSAGSSEDSGSDPNIQNFWGSAGSEAEGTLAITGSLDVSAGVVNGLLVNFLFGVTLRDTGAAGIANDIFITELGGNDAVTLRPLDANGNVIGDFSLAIAASDWGDSGTNQAFQGISNSTPAGIPFGPITTPVAGIAFDLSDFTGTGTLTGVAGIQIDGSLDTSTVGFNTNAVIPEPASFALLALGAALALPRRRRG